MVLANAVEAICLTNEESQFSDEKDAFALLIQTMLSSASGRHAHFKPRSSLRYILEPLIFYADLQLDLVHPGDPSHITFGAQFADWFLGENSEPTEV